MVALPPALGVAPSRGIVATIAACVTFFVFFSVGGGIHRPSFDSSTWQAPATLSDSPHIMSDIQNSTLGFEKLFVINLLERSDKRDAFSLAASVSNMTVEYVDGIKGETVLNKSLPHGVENRPWPEPMIGSWRAHMNTIRTVVEQRISSALIMEDDIDWDINLKSQLNDFAHGTRFLQNQTITDQTHSPYGDGWDVLWLGHCHDTLDETDQRTFVIKNDPTVPAVDSLQINNPEFLHRWPDHSRVVHVVGKPICTFAYALSYQGAQKILWALSVKELKGLFDNALSWWCTGKDQNARCLDAHPSYFAQHRSIGGVGKNSDNQPTKAAQEKEETKNIRFSTRLNIEQLLTGNTNYVDSYPPDQELPSNQAVVEWS